jgi:hypothetical protein
MLSLDRSIDFRYAEAFNWSLESNTMKYSTVARFSNDFAAAVDIIAPTLSISFPNGTNVSTASVVVRDLDNLGVILEAGVHYTVSSSGIFMQIASLYPGEGRNFSVVFYPEESASYGIANLRLTNPSWRDYQPGDRREYVFGTWDNAEPSTFRGPMFIQLDVPNVDSIDTTKVVVYDLDKNQPVPDTEWTWVGGGIQLSQRWMGDVAPSASRSFGVFYLAGENSIVNDLLNPWMSIQGIPIGVWHILWILAAVCLIYGYFMAPGGGEGKGKLHANLRVVGWAILLGNVVLTIMIVGLTVG